MTKPATNNPNPPDDAPSASFEESIEEVERIIDRIERGEVGLEESLREYERGVELLRRCRGVLRNAELKVEELTARMQAEGGNGGSARER
ncbi:MAG: exodeoxyribonuclease VII small subunit [Phycisphaerales bacterium]